MGTTACTVIAVLVALVGVVALVGELRRRPGPIGPRWLVRPIAALAVFLMGEGASYITGTVLPVDGGLTAMMGVHRT